MPSFGVIADSGEDIIQFLVKKNWKPVKPLVNSSFRPRNSLQGRDLGNSDESDSREIRILNRIFDVNKEETVERID